MSKLIVPKEYGNIIARLAPLSILSGSYAVYRGHYGLSVVPFSVGITTYMYWNNPIYSWRRTLDMTVVITAALYQTWAAYYATYMIPYYVFKVLGIGSYLAGLYVHYVKNDQYAGILFHSGIHVFTNIGNFFLYSGDVGDK